VGAGVDTRTDDERRWQETLGARVRKLVQRGHLTAFVIEQARRADHVLLIDFRGPRFNVFVMPRRAIVEGIPKDTDDRMLQEMMQGQPMLEPAEGTATWGFVTDETRPDKAPTHMRLRGLRMS
jgi:hypothetical protein